MHEIRKLRYNAKTLDDEIVKDGLESVSILNAREPYFLVGGIATQGYLPTRCRRPTSDIDFAIVRSLSKPDFREMISPVTEYLHDKGYETSTKINNRSRSFALEYFKADNGIVSSLCLEFVRRNKESFEKHKKRLEREYEHSRQKIVEGRESTYRVSNPEDIAVPKLVRSINSLKRNPEFFSFLIPQGLQPLLDEEVEKRVEVIGDIRAEAMSNPGDPFLAEKLRFISDIYDIRLLSELTGFHQEYFRRAESDWHDIDENPELRDMIFNVVLPAFLEKPQID